MDIKMKEKVNTNTYTFKKRVIEETLELLGRKRNYIINDIEFVTMITFLNNMVENNLIIDALYDEENIEPKMLEFVEPLFEKEVINNPQRLEDFRDVVTQLIDYMEREIQGRMSLSGFLYDIADDLGQMTPDDFMKLVNQILDRIAPKKEGKIKDKARDKQIKEDALATIENAKMKAMIEQYTRNINKKNEDAK